MICTMEPGCERARSRRATQSLFATTRSKASRRALQLRCWSMRGTQSRAGRQPSRKQTAPGGAWQAEPSGSRLVATGQIGR